MYDSAVGHLVRRGAEAVHRCGFHGIKDKFAAPEWVSQGGHHRHGHHGDAVEKALRKLQTPAAVTTLLCTVLAILILDVLVHYTLANVATNLAIAEDMNPMPMDTKTAYTDEKTALNDVETPVVKEGGNGIIVIGSSARPVITASIRSTLKHLRSVSGFFGLWRGFSYAFVYKVAFIAFFIIFSALFPSPYGKSIALFSTLAITCNLHATWTHSTVAAPGAWGNASSRVIPFQRAKHLVLPTLRYLVAANVTGFAAGTALRFGTDLSSSAAGPSMERSLVTGLSWAFGFMILATGTLYAVVPAHIALIRTELALFREEHSAIVPLDRSFGGRINIEELVSGQLTWKQYLFRSLSMRGAYATFDKSTHMRVINVLLTTVVAKFMLVIVGTMVVLLEMSFFGGEEALDALHSIMSSRV